MNKYQEHIRIKKVASGLRISGKGLMVSYNDEETNMICCVIPSLELYSYGDTIEEAKTMLYESMESYFENLSQLSFKKIESELFRMGWSKDKLHNKEYAPIISIQDHMKNDGIVDYNVLELDIPKAA